MAPNNNNREINKPRLRLPFNNKRGDAGEWAFDHRVGLCVTLIAYLVLAIAFVSTKIVVGGDAHKQGFYIELEDISALEELRDRLEEQTKEQSDNFDWNSVRNRSSNETSLDERVKDDRGTDASQLNEQAQEAEEAIRANREAYEKALDEIAASREKSPQESGESGERRDIKVEGNVTVSYTFENPTRNAQHPIVPAYQCQGGGEVVVDVTLNREGKVTRAKVAKGSDRCMQETALNAAKKSTFNRDESAPENHTGSITYIFIPQ